MRVLTLDRAALQHNLHQVRQRASRSKVLAMIKANAYGHGLLPVAEALSSAEGFGVTDVAEALTLRRAGFRQAILVMRGFVDAEELMACAEHEVMVVVHQAHQLTLLAEQTLIKPIDVWLKIDTGMHRLGFAPAQVPAVYHALQANRYVRQVVLMTHFADVQLSDDTVAQRQWQTFAEVAHQLPPLAHSVANSAVMVRHPAWQRDWVRPGILLYGASPFAESLGQDYGLKPVMTLSSQLISTTHLPAGAAIGYGGTYVCPQPMRIGVVALGYADGYPRHAPTGTPVLIGDRCVPLVGRISMDLLTVDLTALPDAQVGERVVLWGQGLAAELVAKRINTIAYELFCQVQHARFHLKMV